jgi:hypothetical protein
MSFGTVGFPNHIYDIWQDATLNLVASHGPKQDWELLDKLFVTYYILREPAAIGGGPIKKLQPIICTRLNPEIRSVLDQFLARGWGWQDPTLKFAQIARVKTMPEAKLTKRQPCRDALLMKEISELCTHNPLPLSSWVLYPTDVVVWLT